MGDYDIDPAKGRLDRDTVYAINDDVDRRETITLSFNDYNRICWDFWNNRYYETVVMSGITIIDGCEPIKPETLITNPWDIEEDFILIGSFNIPTD